MTPLVVGATEAADIAERFRNRNSSEMPDDCEVEVVAKPRKYRYIRPFSDAAEDLIDICQNTDGRWMFGIQSIDVMTRGLGRGELMYVTGRAHSGKCVTHGTIFTMADGTCRRADELQVGNGVMSSRGPVSVEVIEDNGTKPIVRIETHCGRILRVTENHPVSVGGRGWTDASDVEVGNQLYGYVDGWLGYTDAGSNDAAQFVGMYVGDGGWSKPSHEPRFTSADEPIVSWMRDYLADEGFALVERFSAHRTYDYAICGPGFKSYMRSLGIQAVTSHHKLIPDWIMRGGEKNWAAFLGGLLDTDGTVTNGTIAWHSMSRELLVQCQELIERMGASAKLVQKRGTYKGEEHLSWRLSLCMRDGSPSIAELLEPFVVGPKLEKMQAIEHQRSSGNQQKRPYTVKSVTLEPAEPTLAIQVGGDSTIITDGIVTHNTQLCLQSIANNPNAHVMLFTPDEVDVLVLSKLVSIVRGIDGEQLEHRIRNNDAHTIDIVRRCAADDFRNMIVIDQSLTFDQMTVALKEAREYWGCREDVTIVDFLELMPGDGAGNDSVVGKSQGMKAWGKGNETPLICLHQASRSSGARGTSAGMNAMRYGGECLTLDTLLDMADGSRKRADDIVAGDIVIAWGPHDGPRAQPVRAVWDNGVQDIYQVTTSRGRQLAVTGNHPILTRNGYVRADELTTKDDVRVALSHVTVTGDESADLGYFVGAMLGDGHIPASSRNRMSFTNDDQAIIDRMNAITNECFDARLQPTDRVISFTVRGNGWHENNAWKYLDSIGLAGTHSWDKFIPDWVWTAGPDTWLSVLAGLLDTDGTIDKVGRIIVTHTVSERLARDTQQMLARLGFQSSLTIKYKPDYRPCWRVTLTGGIEAQYRFGQIVPIVGRKLGRLAAQPRSKAGRPNRGGLHGYDAVVRIEVLQAIDTIAIEVENDHTFVTNGIVTHNTEATFVLEVFRKLEDTTLEEWERDLVLDTVTVNVAKNKRPPSKKGEVDLFMDPNTGAIRMPKPGDTGVRVTQALPSSVVVISRTAELLGTYAQQKDSNGTSG